MEKLYWNREQCEMCNILTLKQQILSFKHFVILSVLLLLLGGYFLHSFFSLSILHPALVRPSLRPSVLLFLCSGVVFIIFIDWRKQFEEVLQILWTMTSIFMLLSLLFSEQKMKKFYIADILCVCFFLKKERFYGKKIRCFKNGNEMIETDWFDILLWFWY